MPIAIKPNDFRAAAKIIDSCGLVSLQNQIATAIATERERCAQIAEHLNGWGNKAAQKSGLAEHIARVIRGL